MHFRLNTVFSTLELSKKVVSDPNTTFKLMKDWSFILKGFDMAMTREAFLCLLFFVVGFTAAHLHRSVYRFSAPLFRFEDVCDQ